MTGKKSLIICQSIHHENTLKIAQVMAEVLNAAIKKPNEVKPETIKAYNLIGLGSGIYWGKHHQSILKMAEKFPEVKNLNVYIFSTTGVSNKGNFMHNVRYGVSHFHAFLRRILNQKGTTIIDEFNCPGFDTAGPYKLIGGISKGHPDKYDFKKARQFAQKIKAKFNS